MKESFDYDLLVIGGGSGGVRAARMAASFGVRTAIVESAKLGGTCVHRGCVPKKLYVYASHYGEGFHDARAFGWAGTAPSFSWQALQNNKDKEVHRLERLYKKMLEDAGVTIFFDRACLRDEHSVDLEGTAAHQRLRRVTAKNILLATGSRPFVPDFPGKHLVSTSDDIFAQPALPSRIITIGGGYIAVEFAGIFASLGCKSTLVYRGDMFLGRFDSSIATFLKAEMEKKGVKLRFQSEVVCIQRSKDHSLQLVLDRGEQLEADQILCATGRTANTAALGLTKAGLEQDERANIKVDAGFRTNLPSVYALGDVIGRIQLTPVAIAEAMCFVERTFLGKEDKEMDYAFVPTAVFSQPSIGSVGLSEEEAKKRCANIRVYKSAFRSLKYSLGDKPEKCLIKMLVDEDSDRVVGAHMIGPEAGEIIQGIAVALKMGASKKVFDSVVGVHPTLAEEFVSL